MNKLTVWKMTLVVISCALIATYLTFLIACMRREDWQVLVGVATVALLLYRAGSSAYIIIRHEEFQAKLAEENKKAKDALDQLKAEFEAALRGNKH